MTDQSQRGGDNSMNVQAGHIDVRVGLSYSDARQIALDVFQDNFLSLRNEAAETARKRAEQVTEDFFRKLMAENEKGVELGRDPGFLDDLFTVQREFAKTGDRSLGELLLDLLVDRTKQEPRSILQIVLSEGLIVAPKLSADQIANLSAVFLFKNTVSRVISSIPTLLKYLDNSVAPFVGQLTKNPIAFQHLEYTGCGGISIGSTKLGEVFLRNYGGVFSKGFEDGALAKQGIELDPGHPTFTQCLHDTSRLQVNALNEGVVREEATKNGLNEKTTAALVRLFKSTLMSAAEVRTFLEEQRPFMVDLFDVWEDSQMKNFRLTSVGIAIGQANLKRLVGEFTDLAIWVN